MRVPQKMNVPRPGIGATNTAPSPEELRRMFGTGLRRLREDRKLTQEMLAERSTVSVDSIRKMENSRMSPSLETLSRLACGLDLSISNMLAVVEPRWPDPVSQLADLVSDWPEKDLAAARRVLRAMNRKPRDCANKPRNKKGPRTITE